MSKQFYKHITQFTTISQEEFNLILPFFKEQHLKKKEILIEGGTKCDTIHFILEGCVHMYFIGENGVKRTIKFAIENWWISDFLAFHQQSQTDFYIQAVETTKVLSLTTNNHDKLLESFPRLEKYFRIIYQISYGASLNKFRYLYDYSKEQMYIHFVKEFPDFAQRVPQYLIASFLGLTPEYVSEIRKKNVLKLA
ncbi:cAMP-binding domain of CRP or a regulatory subunit of cAMP-dependent protein kinases [Tenacibaculum sp. MAR_2009_124]|uniref:Crp/Fnr family transcriptional regulator n=1 Tax=Tenacibaculum sp. MAR_2009_124 TaxID=1250059 RepID=UPI0008976DAA|nr:Crp/Fnr family transcriptional regulator [Tenacibaculum sp. MAR_2009_124]SEC77411.1 cAMP-binding domain of CRP or a regulatory subunit of cAMP-dependent protein kinases [Tenacibaculum sp. MAR_2009_124]